MDAGAPPAQDAGAPGSGGASDAGSPVSVAHGSEINASNTGVPSGVTLTPMTGGVTLSVPGQVWEAKDLTGSVSVTANNVTIRNCKIPELGLLRDQGCGRRDGSAGRALLQSRPRPAPTPAPRPNLPPPKPPTTNYSPDVCDDERVPHPHIVSESGRAIVAQHCVLVVEAFGEVERSGSMPPMPTSKGHKLIDALVATNEGLSEKNLLESWHDIVQLKDETEKMFDVGLVELDVKAHTETLFWQIAQRIREMVATLEPTEVPDELAALDTTLSTQHICNFSVFQSLLDHWAFGALFPVVPITRLDEKPGLQSRLVDITCDSDGKVSKFIDRDEPSRATVPLHAIDKGPYYLGVFLTGAYQDIMGDIHNLFGRVNEVHVFLDEDEECGYYLEETIEGNDIADVLKMTQYETPHLEQRMKAQVDAAIKQDRVKPTEGMRLLAEYERGLKGQTYLDL